jgi:hypothetical protein
MTHLVYLCLVLQAIFKSRSEFIQVRKFEGLLLLDSCISNVCDHLCCGRATLQLVLEHGCMCGALMESNLQA